MIYAASALCFAAVASAGSVDLTTTNIAQGKGSFDNLVAKWGKSLELGGIKTNLDVSYDYSANKNFISSASLSGDLTDNGDDLSISYEVNHDFGSDSTDATLTASTTASGTTLSAEYNSNDQLREVSASRDIDLGDSKVSANVDWLVKSQTARIKLMSNVGDGSDRASLSCNYKNGDVSGLELGLQHNIEKGRDVSATLSPEKSNVEVEYVDNTIESGATWTATANVPTEGGNLMDTASVTLKRSWEW
jgi:YD repeat-containing protein